ncbi:uncharacterized protein [Nicotiana tomentosiformis]|uniref:uncharacterized protein n=1 Tax=Nicotiana tomentosiformis TaxID=4098 RepID=UPI00051C1784|nr:uncharacterized protein LOC104118269 [Nicotiana tomentosiformis]
MMMKVGDQVEEFNVYKALRFPAHYEELSMIFVVESDATSSVPYMSPIDPLERALISDEEDSEDEMMGEIEKVIDMSCIYVHGFGRFEELERLVTPTPPKSSIEEAPKLELKPLPVHMCYAYLGNSETLPMIISSSLTNVQEEKLFRVLREHKKAIGWTIADIKGISPSFCMHKIFLEDGHNPSVEQQRILNAIMKEVVKKEVIKWLYAGIIFPVSDSNWIVICLEDQEKTTFTCPYGTFSFKHMSFGLCNAPSIFQRCMMAIFTDMVENFVESLWMIFQSLGLLMITEGIVLGHNVSRSGIEVDKVKVEAVEKLPPPIYVKGVRSFLGNAGFYRRFIKDFSKISTPLCKLLEEDVTFNFDDTFLKAFDEIKKTLVAAPIIVAPD